MLTDSLPRKNRSGFLESERIKTLDVPRNGALEDIAKRLESAMKSDKKSDKIRDVQSACTEFLTIASRFYGVPARGVRVLTARPLRTRERGTFELFGDYTPDSMLIRAWMTKTSIDSVWRSASSSVSPAFCASNTWQPLDSRNSRSTLLMED